MHSSVQTFLNSFPFSILYECPFPSLQHISPCSLIQTLRSTPFTHTHTFFPELDLPISLPASCGPLCLLLSFLLSSQQHLILRLVCPPYFPALSWQTVGGLLKVVGESLDSFHQGYPGGRLIGKVIYCPVSVQHSSFSTSLHTLLLIRLSIHSFVSNSLQIYTCCLEVKVSVGVIVSVCVYMCVSMTRSAGLNVRLKGWSLGNHWHRWKRLIVFGLARRLTRRPRWCVYVASACMCWCAHV